MYMCVYMCICIYTHIYIHTYIYRDMSMYRILFNFVKTEVLTRKVAFKTQKHVFFQIIISTGTISVPTLPKIHTFSNTHGKCRNDPTKAVCGQSSLLMQSTITSQVIYLAKEPLFSETSSICFLEVRLSNFGHGRRNQQMENKAGQISKTVHQASREPLQGTKSQKLQ